MIEISDYVEKGSEEVKTLIRGQQTRFMRGESFYHTVLNELSDGTRNNETQLTYLDAFEQALGVFREGTVALRDKMDVLTLEQRSGFDPSPELQGKIDAAVFFSNRYALHFAGQVGLALLDTERAEVENRFTFGTEYDQSKDRDDLTGKLAKVATDDLNRVLKDKTDAELKDTLQAVLLKVAFSRKVMIKLK